MALFLQVLWVAGHGMLKLPRSRVSAWRKQGCCEAPNPKVWENGWCNTPAYYDDMATHCGGKHFDLVTPKTCNICGGRAGTKKFMAPGRYATGTITGQYKSGGTIKLEYEGPGIDRELLAGASCLDSSNTDRTAVSKGKCDLFGEDEKLQVSKKGPYDFVTKTDKHVEKILIEELQKAHPEYGIITEEAGVIILAASVLDSYYLRDMTQSQNAKEASTSPRG